MKIICIIVILVLCGCSVCEKKQPIRDYNNNIVRENNKDIIKERAAILSEKDKIEIRKAYLSMDFALDAGEKTYKNKVRDLKNKHSMNKDVLDLIVILDNQVYKYVETFNIIEAKHLIHNAIRSLEK